MAKNKIEFIFPDVSDYVRNFQKNVIERFYETFEQLFRDSTAEFLRTVVDEILVDTGMSGGSLLPLARMTAKGALNPDTKEIPSLIRTELIALRKINSRKGVVVIDGSFRPDLKRSIRQGEKFGKTFKLETGSPISPIMELFFQINVFQFQFHEDGGKMRRALDKGLDAFLQFYRSNFDLYFPQSKVTVALNAFIKKTTTAKTLGGV